MSSNVKCPTIEKYFFKNLLYSPYYEDYSSTYVYVLYFNGSEFAEFYYTNKENFKNYAIFMNKSLFFINSIIRYNYDKESLINWFYPGQIYMQYYSFYNIIQPYYYYYVFPGPDLYTNISYNYLSGILFLDNNIAPMIVYFSKYPTIKISEDYYLNRFYAYSKDSKYYQIYYYVNPYLNNISLAKYISFSTEIPQIDLNYIEKVKTIDLETLKNISNKHNISFYLYNSNLSILNGEIYSGNIINNSKYSKKYTVYIMDENKIYKDLLIIYLK